jgi:hypothetical protein
MGIQRAFEEPYQGVSGHTFAEVGPGTDRPQEAEVIWRRLMANGQQLAEQNFQVFIAWLSSRTGYTEPCRPSAIGQKQTVTAETMAA